MLKRTWNLAIVEPNFIICAGLTRIFARTALKERLECASMEQLWASLTVDHDIDLFLIDIGTDFSFFAEDLEKLKESFPDAFIALLADRIEDDLVHKTIQAGVHGLIAKGMRIEAIVKSLELILLGEPFFPPTEAKEAKNSHGNGQSRNGSIMVNGHARAHQENISALNLSSREIEVLMSLREGKSNKEIARDLDISDATVKVHVKAILRKLRMKNRTEAALWATGARLLDSSMHQH